MRGRDDAGRGSAATIERTGQDQLPAQAQHAAAPARTIARRPPSTSCNTDLVIATPADSRRPSPSWPTAAPSFSWIGQAIDLHAFPPRPPLLR